MPVTKGCSVERSSEESPRTEFSFPGAAASAAAQLRYLGYYHDLLAIGYHYALHPDPFPRSLRGERIALGIDLAVLDTVPLWSTRRADGAVAIPMVEFILERFGRCVDEFCDALDLQELRGLEELRDAHRALRDELAAILPHEDKDAGLARPADICIPADRLGSLFGRNGLLRRILSDCESLLGAASNRAQGECPPSATDREGGLGLNWRFGPPVGVAACRFSAGPGPGRGW